VAYDPLADGQNGIETPLRRLTINEGDPAWLWRGLRSRLLVDALVAPRVLRRWIGGRLAVRDARRRAVRLTDWREMAALPDGAIVSLSGRLVPGQSFPVKLAGRSVAGMLLRFPMQVVKKVEEQTDQLGLFRTRSFVVERTATLEVAFDFEMENAAGQRLLVRVDGTRIMGRPTSWVQPGSEMSALIAQMDLPLGASEHHHCALFLCSGQQIEVMGMKESNIDLAMDRIHRDTPLRYAIGATTERPAFVIPSDK
jgi:hypothetical protein